MKLKFGVIGAGGYWGKNYLRLFKDHPDAELVAVCDSNSDNLEKIKQDYPNVTAYADSGDFVKHYDFDCGIVCTPVKIHAKLVADLLGMQKHVLCEKAFTSNSEDAKTLIKFADYNKKKLAVGHTYIHNTCVGYIKELLDKKEFGDVYYVSMTRVGMSPVRQDVNAAWDLGAHDFSMLIHWFGMPKNVSSYGKSYLNDGVEDVVFSNLEFENNIMAHVKNSWLNPTKNRTVTIVGSKKMIVFDDIEKSVEVYDSKGKLENVHDLDNDPLRKQLGDFIGTISLDVKPLVTGEDGLNVVKVLEAATQSLKNNSGKVFL